MHSLLQEHGGVARRGQRAGRGARFVALLAVVGLITVGVATAGVAATNSKASSQASVPGVTKDSISISLSGPYSGVYGAIGKQTFAMSQAWADHVNAAGGIQGRKIKLVQVDNQFTPEGAVAACKEIKGNGTFFSINSIDGGDEVSCVDAAGIPQLVTASGLPVKKLNALKNTVFGRAAYFNGPTEASFLGSKYVNAKKKKIGIVSGSGPAFAGGYAGLTAALKKQGFDVVHTERTSADGLQASFVPEMQRMKDSGAQVVLLDVVLEASGIIRDAKAVGYDPDFVLGPLATQDIFTKASPDAFKGIKGLRYETTVESPAYKKWEKSLSPDAAALANPTNAAQYAFMDVVGAILNAAGKNPTRASFLAAAKSMENYDQLNLIGPFTTKGELSPVGQRSLFPLQCCNPDNTYKLLGPPAQQF